MHIFILKCYHLGPCLLLKMLHPGLNGICLTGLKAQVLRDFKSWVLRRPQKRVLMSIKGEAIFVLAGIRIALVCQPGPQAKLVFTHTNLFAIMQNSEQTLQNQWLFYSIGEGHCQRQFKDTSFFFL